MKYLFFVNVQKDAEGRLVGFFDGYKQGHALELAYSGEVDAADEMQACSLLFEKFNIDHPRDYRNRSMSAGDVVVLNNRNAYSCESVGWKEVPLPLEAEGQHDDSDDQTSVEHRPSDFDLQCLDALTGRKRLT
jgi:hypothetical protein